MTHFVTALSEGSVPPRTPEIVSPELALVDPVMAEHARAWHPVPGDTLRRIEKLVQARRIAATRPPPTHTSTPVLAAPRRDRPSFRPFMRGRRSRVLAGGVISAIFVTALLVGVRVDVDGNRAGADAITAGLQPTKTTPVVVPSKQQTPRARKHSRSGTPSKSGSHPVPRRFAWAPVTGAASYHVELFRDAARVFAAETTQDQITIPAHWTHGGAGQTLEAGEYRWLVWPVVAGRRSARAIVQATLVIS